jgi:heme exporter protein A
MLRIENLTIARGGVPVLAGLSLEVAPGEVLVLRGPNGIGKTTLLRTIAGLQPPVAGTVTVDRDRLAYAGHTDGIKPTLTVAENLRFWAAVFGTGDVAPALAAYGLAPLAGRAAAQLSAGQKRRLGLARMGVTGRALWLMDEPTVSLDADAVGLFAAAVRAHCAAGGAAVLATHIELGLEAARVLELSPYRAAAPVSDRAGFDEAFL